MRSKIYLTELEGAVKDECRKKCRKLANLYSRKITQAYYNAISLYYADYDPQYYSRTYDLRRSAVKRVKDRGRDVWGGVSISADRMSDYKSDSAEYVLFNTILADDGTVHGNPDIPAGINVYDYVVDYVQHMFDDVRKEANK